MKYLCLLAAYVVFELQASNYTPECNPPCPSGRMCVNVTKGRAECRFIPRHAPKTFVLPFAADTEVYCTHSFGVGSHSYLNTFFALDLATDYSKPASIVRAGASGIAYIGLGENGRPCPVPEGTPAKSDPQHCGDGWGNRVKILHSEGYFSFYTHLDRVFVRDGQPVGQGDPLGIEGTTGLAGHRHLHWSVNRLPGTHSREWLTQIKTYTGTSVPFTFRAIREANLVWTNCAKLIAAHSKIGDVPPEQQPKFRGVIRRTVR
jgi:murein DD-endopeptidase MepM/ murein hydrolase activator NlpD